MKTEIELGIEHGLTKVARIINMEINFEKKIIYFHYKTLLLSTENTIVSQSNIITLMISDKDEIKNLKGDVIAEKTTNFSDLIKKMGTKLTQIAIDKIKTN